MTRPHRVPFNDADPETGKIPIPAKPKEYMESSIYFERKEELEALKKNYQQELEENKVELEKVKAEYDDVVINGNDKQISEKYQELKHTQELSELIASKYHSLVDSGNIERILDDLALQKFMSNTHAVGMFKNEAETVKQEYLEAKKQLQRAIGKVNNLNARYKQKRYAGHEIMRDRGWLQQGTWKRMSAKYGKLPDEYAEISGSVAKYDLIHIKFDD